MTWLREITSIIKKYSDIPFTGEVTNFISDDSEFLHKGRLREGKKDGEWIELVKETGRVLRRINWKDGDVESLEVYHKNGQLLLRSIFKDRQRNGFQEMYYQNGQLMSKGKLKNEKRVGLWVFYNKNGELKEKKKY